MDPAQVFLAIVGALVTAAGSVLAWRKWGPERGLITVTTADKVNEMTLRFAGHVDKANDDLRADLATLRREFDQYRTDTQSRLDELGALLRAEKAEKELVKQENDRLRKRVDELEAEVARLKSRA